MFDFDSCPRGAEVASAQTFAEWKAEADRFNAADDWAKETSPVVHAHDHAWFSVVWAVPGVSRKGTPQWEVFAGNQAPRPGNVFCGEFIGWWDGVTVPTAEDCAAIFAEWQAHFEE